MKYKRETDVIVFIFQRVLSSNRIGADFFDSLFFNTVRLMLYWFTHSNIVNIIAFFMHLKAELTLSIV